MRRTIDILGVKIDSITMKQAIDKINGFITEGGLHAVYTPNSEIVMAAQRDPELKDILNNGDMVVPDGAGILLAGKILGEKFPEKVSGVDLVKEIFKQANSKREISFFLLGAEPGIAERACINVLNSHKYVKIAGYHHGYFNPEEEEQIIKSINESQCDILLVALGAPKQEKWIATHRDKLNVKVCIGVGGTFDILAGKSKLAPEYIRRMGLEWLYRLIQEPRRYKRMLDLPRFVVRVIKKKLLKSS